MTQETKKVSREQLLAILGGPVSREPPPPPVESLRASEIVTYPALAGVLAVLEERHNGLVSMLEEKFRGLEERMAPAPVMWPVIVAAIVVTAVIVGFLLR